MRVLDLGCGRTGAHRREGKVVIGVDVDLDALRSSAECERRLVVCARGEQLPFRDRSFSHVGSGVALPYMRIPAAIGEISRVLCPGGSIRLSLHPWTMTTAELFRAIRTANLRNTSFRCYILLNGIYFHLTGRQFRFPLRQTRCETFQTMARMSKTLAAAGFDEVHWERSRQFVVSARKPS
jgi:ubiquinone/menaquinone biosynthesis C-methylase UbiE